MKNILIIALVGLLIIGAGSTTFAAGRSSGQAIGEFQGGSIENQRNARRQTTDQGSETGPKQGNGEAYQARKQNLERNRQQVRSNTEETTRLRTQINNCSEELKLLIQKKLQNGEDLSTEEILRYKEAIQILSLEREQILLEHQGKIQEQMAIVCQARLQGDTELANTAMNNIRTEQELRIVVLTKVLENLKDLLADNY